MTLIQQKSVLQYLGVYCPTNTYMTFNSHLKDWRSPGSYPPPTLVYTHLLWFTPTYSGLPPPTLVYPHLLWFTPTYSGLPPPTLVYTTYSGYPHLLWLRPPTLVYTTHSGLHHPLWFTNRIEPRFRDFRPGLTQTNLYNHRSRLKA